MSKTWWAAALLTLTALAPDMGRAAPVPVADFFRLPAQARSVVSPDGRYLATVASPDGRRNQLAVVDLQDPSASKALVAMQDSDIYRIQWVSPRRIVFDVTDLADASGRPVSAGLWAIDVDGKDFKPLIAALPDARQPAGRNPQDPPLLPWNWRLHSVLAGAGDEVMAEELVFEGGELKSTRLARLDTRTGAKKPQASNAPEGMRHWLLDRQGQVLAAAGEREGRRQTYLALDGGKRWFRWQSAEPGLAEARLQWLGIGPQGELIAAGPLASSGHDRQLLMRLDWQQSQAKAQVLVDVKGYDFDGQLVQDAQGRLLGAHVDGETPDSVWFSPELKALQAEVDEVFKGTVNRILCHACPDAGHAVVRSASDRQPEVLSLYNRQTRQFSPLLRSRPWIKAAEMAARETTLARARDGRALPLLLTRPVAAGDGQARRLPAVLLAHGGPALRGNHWEWQDEAQFLASRGYLVIEVDYRGSAGYGLAHEQAGWGQWGLAMQDDLADAARWAVQAGHAEAGRLCLLGGGYGGYAVLMGLMREDSPFRCGVAWSAIADLPGWLGSRRNDPGEPERRQEAARQLGHLVRDQARLLKTSPLAQAAQLKKPLLLAHGEADWRVPMADAEALRDALLAAKAPLQWQAYPDEGHGWRQLKNLEDFWGRVERFLGEQLKP
jgi:dienelactone hydrolase